MLQLRVDMGLLQMELVGRPDGVRPEGFDTYYDYLIASAFEEGEDFLLTAERCVEIDREFVQFYHRRVAWLSLREYRQAILDADHTLALMSFSTAHAPDEHWAELHEQYRPLVLFHRTQAGALAGVSERNPRAAVVSIDRGLHDLREVFRHQGLADEFDQDELIVKLKDMKSALATQFDSQPSLDEQLAEAVASEQYELAAELRDRIADGQRTIG
ncbi:UvrB/UvrC motif-containing protein [Pseudobythopirellula maris]|uniref:UvrB/UvrC motif-containing protein n=1 Tax=Pseudobythopirellula maris TaxID=2527991 RepID=UPI001E4D6765|nr:UvrB/UvrC motif-containing protein [Pseudobythopirellula maris]